MLYVGDFECPFSAQVRPTVERIVERYGDRLRVVWMNYPQPFHPNAMKAAEAAMEAYAQQGDRGFWRVHALLDNRFLYAAALETAAQEAGLDMPRFREALRDGHHRHAVRRDQVAFDASGARAGTPVFFINGRLLRGAQPFERFVAAIERALAETRRDR